MPEPADRLRAHIRTLQVRRRSLESKLLQPQQMIAATLLERFLGSGCRRRSPACYLSRSHQGRSKLNYVKREEVAAVRSQCEAYHGFRENLKQWRRLDQELETLFKGLLQAQVR